MQGALAPLNRAKSVDDQLLELAAMEFSPEEISRRMGGIINPAQVRLKVDELTKNGNWLTAVQQEHALLSMLRTNLMEMRSETFDLDNIKLQHTYVETLLKRADRRQEITASQLETYDANVGAQLGAVVDAALSYMKGALREEVDAAKWDALVAEALEDAWVKINSKIAVAA